MSIYDRMPEDIMASDMTASERAAFREQHERARGVLARWRAHFPLRHVKAAEAIAAMPNLPPDFAPHVNAGVEALNAGGVLVICGPRGRGKTLLATYLAMTGASRGVEAEYWRMADLFGAFRHRCFGPDGQSEVKVLKDWARLPLLVLDELQDAQATEFTATLLSRLLDHRYARETPTILISNLTIDALREHVGKSAASRLDETGTFIVMDGVNHRLTKGQA